MNKDVKNVNTYAWSNPSKISKYKLTTAGAPTGITIWISSITTNAPSTLPKSRIASDKGLVNNSKIFIGFLPNPFNHPPTPLLRIDATCTRTILIKASAAVTLISFVGGLKPKIPNMLLSPIKKRTEQIYGA